MSVLQVHFEHEGAGDLFLPSIEILPRRYSVCIRKIDKDFRAKSLFVPAVYLSSIKILELRHKRGDSPWCDRIGATVSVDTEILLPMAFVVRKGDYLSLKAENISDRKFTYAPLIIGTEI